MVLGVVGNAAFSVTNGPSAVLNTGGLCGSRPGERAMGVTCRVAFIQMQQSKHVFGMSKLLVRSHNAPFRLRH